MHINRILKKLIGVENLVIENVEYDDIADVITIAARPFKRDACRCGRCSTKAKVYDAGRGVRQWRCLDAGSTKVFIVCSIYRVDCPIHGVTVIAVPWARHDSLFCRTFEDQCCWHAVNTSKSCVAELFRIDWHTVGSICNRVFAELKGQAPDPFENLINIGIDETSFKKGHRYITVVINHDTSSIVWCAEGHNKATLDIFFASLTPNQRSSIKCVSADGARWIKASVTEYCPEAILCIDPFHVVSWATGALDEIRKQIWREAHKAAKQEPKRGRGRPKPEENVNPLRKQAQAIKGSRYPLLKNPEDLTASQQATLDVVQKSNTKLYRAYRLKEGLREIFRLPPDKVKTQLDTWLSWAQRCRIPEFVELGKKIRRHHDSIIATMKHGLSNARVEAINNKIKLTVKMAYGFRNIDNLLALLMLRCSNIKVCLPGR